MVVLRECCATSFRSYGSPCNLQQLLFQRTRETAHPWRILGASSPTRQPRTSLFSDGATDTLAIGTVNAALFGSRVPLPTGPITMASSIASTSTSTSRSSAAPSPTGTTQPPTPRVSVPLGATIGVAVAGVIALLAIGLLIRMCCRRAPPTPPQVIDPEPRETGAYSSGLVYTPYEAPAAGGELLYSDRDAEQNLPRQPLSLLPSARTAAGSRTSGGTRYAESASEGSGSASRPSAGVLGPRPQVYPQDSKVLTGTRNAPPLQYLP
ncbi:hypothetical protein FIBSPDRAFT_1055414 [Athelia psychrophila]|uniref:Uncharacterized protein n=1 Tax=Athelia psychrophila TaxID=1759441 RepID=A0A167TS13_9AGAM|nr:hypothetical protein FIBSPDRAFT_1055414 [Fibularhizoctonia sp. CBS 109695]